jgi:hypothetical protein
MNVTRKQERLLHRALAEWEQEGALSASDRQRLAATLKRTALDWQRLSRYAIWTALACAIIAIGSLFADSVLMAWIIDFLSFSSLARIGLPALLAMVFYLWGFARQRRETQWHYTTEGLLFLGVLFTAIALWQLGERLDNGSGHIAPLFLAGCAVYGLVGYFGRSFGGAIYTAQQTPVVQSREPVPVATDKMLEAEIARQVAAIYHELADTGQACGRPSRLYPGRLCQC